MFTNMGALFGLAAGALLLPRFGGFEAGGAWEKRGLRFLVGLVGILILWRGLGAILPTGEYPLAYILRYIRYALIGLWVTGAAPVLFTRLGLAERSVPAHKPRHHTRRHNKQTAQ
jgi:hypothetical protein